MTTTGTTTTAHISVADCAATITSNRPAVTDWTTRYFGSWWNASLRHGAVDSSGVHVTADVHPGRCQQLAEYVEQRPDRTVTYARKALHLREGEGSITAYGADQVAYHVQPDGHIIIAGHDSGRVASAAARLAREALRGQLARDGWVLMHASAVVRDGRALVACGGKGAGKTSTAFQLAHANGWSLLANDRLFARPDARGDVQVLPWPAAAALGLGLLTAMGWYDVVADAGDKLHSSTPTELLAAFARGARHAMHDGERELKAQLFPDQIATLFRIPLATTATVDEVLFPTVRVDAPPAVTPGGRDVNDDDTFVADIEDRYPPVFGLREPESDEARDAVFDHLNELPRQTLTLGHDIAANSAILAALTGV